MNLKFEISLLFVGGILRILVLVFDIWFLITQDMGDILRYIGIFSLLAPTVIMIIAYSIILLQECLRGEITKERLQVVLLFVIGDSIGLNYFVFSFILCNSQIMSGDFYIIDSMFRASALVNSLFQSMPQIVYQAITNQINDQWNEITILTIGATGVSLVYTIYKLMYAIDKVNQYNSAVRIETKVENISNNNSNKVTPTSIPVSTDNQDDVYE